MFNDPNRGKSFKILPRDHHKDVSSPVVSHSLNGRRLDHPRAVRWVSRAEHSLCVRPCATEKAGGWTEGDGGDDDFEDDDVVSRSTWITRNVSKTLTYFSLLLQYTTAPSQVVVNQLFKCALRDIMS